MSVAALSRFFALLALATNALVVAVAVTPLVGRLSPQGATLRERVLGAIAESALPLSWLIATVATLGSLYYSEVVHLPPCRLCWYQRIAMYPLALVLGIAAARRDRAVWRYALPLVAVGAVIALYHYALEWNPALDAGVCTTDVPCSAVLFRVFGFISLPYMALSGFVAIGVLMALAARRPHEET